MTNTPPTTQRRTINVTIEVDDAPGCPDAVVRHIVQAQLNRSIHGFNPVVKVIEDSAPRMTG